MGYADFDADGTEDMIVSVTCGAGGTYMDEFALPLTARDGKLAILGGKPLTQVVGDQRGGELSRIRKGSIRLEGATVVVDEMYRLTDDEPQCCMTGRATVRWGWKGNGFAPTVPSTPGTGLDVTKLSTAGIGALEFGDPVSEAEALAGKKAVKSQCGNGGKSYIQDARPGLSLYFENGRFDGYVTTNAEHTTTSGVRISMSADEAKRRIPSLQRRAVTNVADALVVSSDGYDVIFSLFPSGSIRQISAGRDLAKNGEFC